jgi:hypothetical protein
VVGARAHDHPRSGSARVTSHAIVAHAERLSRRLLGALRRDQLIQSGLWLGRRYSRTAPLGRCRARA